MVLTQITKLHANGGLNRVENETLGIYQIGNLDTRRINVGANIKRVRVQQRPNEYAKRIDRRAVSGDTRITVQFPNRRKTCYTQGASFVQRGS